MLAEGSGGDRSLEDQGEALQRKETLTAYEKVSREGGEVDKTEVVLVKMNLVAGGGGGLRGGLADWQRRVSGDSGSAAEGGFFVSTGGVGCGEVINWLRGELWGLDLEGQEGMRADGD